MEPEELKKIFKEVLKEEIGPFFIEREQHFLDHEFMKGVRETKDKIISTGCGAVTKSGVAGVIILILWGIAEFVKKIKQ